MSDPYIDQFETLAYGPFAAQQIVTLVVGLEAAFDTALAECAGRITTATTAMELALKKAGEIETVTYKQAPGAEDPLANARAVLARAVSYAQSRAGGAAIAKKMLGDEALSTVQRRRPQKLVAALGVALGVVVQEKAKLPEQAAWSAELAAARDALDVLDKKVRSSRVTRRAMTPEVAAAREAWMRAYGGSKLVVEGVLKLAQKLPLLAEVFDDLAEAHKVAGVSDGEPVPAPAAPKP